MRMCWVHMQEYTDNCPVCEWVKTGMVKEL